MKAFLLVGGLGTRLRPLTDTLPKCLVEIGKRPLIDWWIDNLVAAGISEVLVNLHHLPDQVEAHLNKLSVPLTFTFFREETLLGSAGTLRENAGFVSGEKSFLVVYGDNFTSIDLNELVSFHHNQPHPVSMALFHSKRPTQCGIVELDASNTVISFVEKPAEPKSDLANAGLYVFNTSVLDSITSKTPADIGFDLLPQFVHNMSGWITQDYLIDVGTHENLAKAREDYEQLGLWK